MAAPTVRTVDTVPPPATRADAPADYVPKQDKFMAALPPLAVQINGVAADMNALGGYLDQLKSDVNGYKSAAAQSVTDAATQANNALSSANQAKDYRDSSQAAAAAAQAAAGLPAISGKADFMLSVNSAGNGVEWRPSVPRPTVGTSGYAVVVNPAGTGFIAQAIPVNPVTKYFESALLNIATSTNASAIHGLGARPKFAAAHLYCKTATLGYVVGDTIEIASHAIYSGDVIPLVDISFDATRVYAAFGTNINYRLIPKAGGTPTVILLSDYFNIVLRTIV